MKLVAVETPSDVARWDAFVESFPSATTYHQYAWRTVFMRTYGLDCYYLAAVNEKGLFLGVLPLVHLSSLLFGNELVSLPFVNYGGVLCNDDVTAGFLLENAGLIARKLDATKVELRHSSFAMNDLPTRQHKVSMILTLLPDATGQWKRFNPKLRNQVRKAEKCSLHTKVGTFELLDVFYEVIARNMRDLGSPVHAKEFFRNVLEALPDTSMIITVLYKDQTIAAALVCWYRDTMEIPWASSVREFNSMCPNNLLYWTAIQFAISCGMTRFDFGRSTPNEGTFNFKAQWGALPLQLNWQYPIGQAPLSTKDTDGRGYQLAIELWKRLPVGLTKKLGPLVRKNIGL